MYRGFVYFCSPTHLSQAVRCVVYFTSTLQEPFLEVLETHLLCFHTVYVALLSFFFLMFQ